MNLICGAGFNILGFSCPKIADVRSEGAKRVRRRGLVAPLENHRRFTFETDEAKCILRRTALSAFAGIELGCMYRRLNV